MCHKTQVSEKVEFIKLFLMVSIIIPTYNSSFFYFPSYRVRIGTNI